MSKQLIINKYNIDNYNLDVMIKATNIIFFDLDESFDFSKYTHITHLTFSYEFNQPVDNLPPNITHLTLGHNFNKTIDNLPNTLIEITFRTVEYYENYNINMLPDNIQIIKINYKNINLKNKILLSRHADKLKIE